MSRHKQCQAHPLNIWFVFLRFFISEKKNNEMWSRVSRSFFLVLYKSLKYKKGNKTESNRESDRERGRVGKKEYEKSLPAFSSLCAIVQRFPPFICFCSHSILRHFICLEIRFHCLVFSSLSFLSFTLVMLPFIRHLQPNSIFARNADDSITQRKQNRAHRNDWTIERTNERTKEKYEQNENKTNSMHAMFVS